MQKFKKTAMITLAFFILSGVMTAFPVSVSAGFLSAYDVLKLDYPEVVANIVAGGCNEGEIKEFLIALETDVSKRGTLNEANFNSIMYQSFEEVIQWRAHRNVFRALLKSYGDEIEYTLDNSELHPDLVPIRNAVMKSLLGEEEKPPVSGGGVTTSPNSDINQAISAELSKSAKVIQVDVSKYPELVLPGSLLNDVSRKGKTLELSWSGLKITLPPGAVNMDSEDKLTISAKTLSSAREAETAQKAGTNLKLISEIYDIQVSTLETPRNFAFTKPVDIALTYSIRETTEVQKSLALYFYNEKNLDWEKLSGNHDLSARYIRVTTNQPGKYALFAAVAATVTAEPEPVSSSFIDITGHWAEQDINIMYQKGLVSGVTTFMFEPERSITRAEFAAIMLRAMGEQPGTYMTGRFYDVPADAWYFSAVNRAAEVGIISGYSSTSFGPRDPVTREQIAAIISRAMQIKNKGAAVSDSEVPFRLNVFADQKNISIWAGDGVAFAAANNIVKGRSATEFAPHATATRAEATAMILRMYNQL
jgi:hypothetical protein